MSNSPALKVPTHVAVIMDGNRRWAKARGLPQLEGHRRGAEAARRLMDVAIDMGIPYVTLYTFSSENGSRSEEEIKSILFLLQYYFKSHLSELHQKGVRIRIIGNRHQFPADIQETLEAAEEMTRNNNTLTAILAFGYGARGSITDAVKRYALDVERRLQSPATLTEEIFKDYLETRDIPNPDLLVRPGGEHRLSNFLLWEMAYTELFFTDVLWPDFGRTDMMAALADYTQRERRFGA